MNTNRLLQVLGLGVLILLTACQAARQPLSATMAQSGDAINGMRLTTGAVDAPPLWAFCSNSQDGGSQQILNCRAPLLPTLAIGHISLLADEVLAHTDWSDLAWELSIDERAVDLESFGTFEYVMPAMTKSPSPVREVFKTTTAWNIMLTNLNPGEHTLRFVAQNNSDSYTWLVNLVIEEAGGTDISSIPFPPHS